MNSERVIIPHLWFDKEAKEAAEFYTSHFPNSKITDMFKIHEVPTPTGDCDVIDFNLSGHSFKAINAGPEFKINPSVSFILNFDSSTNKDARKQLDSLWDVFSQEGTVLMPIEKYFFSDRYGWIQDKYGVSWQLILSNQEGENRPFIVPSLLFVGDVAGRAEEAVDFYLSIFKNSKKGFIARYGKDQEPDQEGTVMYCDFMLNGQWFAAMDSAHEHNFKFNEALSFIIPCQTQDEIDYYWEKLSADPKAEICGWLKDKFGVSWQINPLILDQMLKKGTKEQCAKVTKEFLNMKKLDIAQLVKAYEG